ncbi:ExeM/NucH family extracellular endonuclease [Marinobacter salicampi]|uniref:ExeM/NucH family extracellular endonuclease n=1 Tax=Marinobacter salicampi TaxID=435907 RepID=UPI001F5F81C8|nr:ExeM/NucH family extracellular endonuclease [Marinobacter salicampi]
MKYPPVSSALLVLLSAFGPPLLAAECGVPATAIALVQGSGDRSPMAGEKVTVEGIVTHDARHSGGWRGVYIQQADALADTDPTTSEALFVFTDSDIGKTSHRVRVSGEVREFHGLTELTQVTHISDCGPAPLPEAVTIPAPWPNGVVPEYLENMRVIFTKPLTVIDTYHLARYGELTLAETMQWVPTQLMPPGPVAARLFNIQLQQRLVLDDGHSRRDPRPVAYPPPGLSYHHTLRAGDTVAGLNGVLDFRFGAWRLQPTTTPEFTSENPRPQPPEKAPGSNFRVVTLNLGNYFNGNGEGEGFLASRGADSEGRLRAQTDQLVATVRGLAPDVLTVMEVENDGYGTDSALATLTEALGDGWHYASTQQAPGTDAIRVGILYQSRIVAPEGQARVQPQSGKGRPAISQTFRLKDRDTRIRVIAVHLKSKGCRHARGDNLDQNDGQGCFAKARAEAATELTAWLDSLGSPEHLAGMLLTGDFNSYARERPMEILAEAGFTDLVRHYHGYKTRSFRYKGRAGTLDYILADDRLKARAKAAQVWTINADEPPSLGYQGPFAATEDKPGPWRSSDHDPVFVDLDLQ